MSQLNSAKQSILVCVARLGTGAGGRTGAKGGRGTDWKEGPRDGARPGIRGGENNKEIQRRVLSRVLLILSNFAETSEMSLQPHDLSAPP